MKQSTGAKYVIITRLVHSSKFFAGGQQYTYGVSISLAETNHRFTKHASVFSKYNKSRESDTSAAMTRFPWQMRKECVVVVLADEI